MKQFFYLLFPTKKLAEASPRPTRGGRKVAYQDAKWLSQEFKCNVFVVEPNTCVVLLEVDNGYFKVLDCNGNIGWIRCWDFSKHFKLVKE